MRLDTPPPRPSGDAPPWVRWLIMTAVGTAIYFLWSTPFLYPLKILVVFFHELSHGLAALATGGRVVDIEIVAREGGLCRTMGGNRFLTLSAGYLGSLVFGGLILLAAARTRRDRELAVGLGLLLGLSALLWVRPLLSFGFPFTLAVAAALVLAGLYLPVRWVDVLLSVVGITSMLYAVVDIQDDILARPHLLESDAARLAALTGVPTLVWGALWIVLAVAGTAFFLHLAGGAPWRRSKGRRGAAKIGESG